MGSANGPRIVDVRAEIEHQAEIDRVRRRRAGISVEEMLRTRMGAVIVAQRAVRAGAEGAPFALRAAAIDLAAISERLAETMPPPRDPDREVSTGER